MHASIPHVPGKVMVVGFCFTLDRQLVILILKNKPEWQRGKLNGVGGKIKLDTNESPGEAMVREWHEETGTTISEECWRLFCELRHGDNYVFFFETRSVEMFPIPSQPEGREQANWFKVENILSSARPAINNLKWLLPLADEADTTVKAHDTSKVQC
jgi:8-oxo-dGTP diphosphatase